MEYLVYILKSLKDDGYYVGITNNIQKRLQTHNYGSVRSTKYRIPFKVIYMEKFATRVEARNREKYLKSYAGSREKLNIIDNLNR